MAVLKVTPEQLQGVATQLRNGASNIEGVNSQLRGNVQPLGSEWAGLAQARFTQLWEQWARSSRELNDALNGIATLMNQAGASYATTEEQIARSFGRA